MFMSVKEVLNHASSFAVVNDASSPKEQSCETEDHCHVYGTQESQFSGKLGLSQIDLVYLLIK